MTNIRPKRHQARPKRKASLNMPDFIPTEFSVSQAIVILRPLVIYVAGMAVYAIFIFKFHRFIGSRDIFEYDLAKYQQARFRSVRIFIHAVSYVAKYLLVFPFVAFFWFAILTVMLSFLAKDEEITTVLLVSMAVVSAIRVTAYYNEDLSRDLAKVLPYALLGIFVVKVSYFEVAGSLVVLQLVVNELDTILYYLVFVIALEFVMRITRPVVSFSLMLRKRDLERQRGAPAKTQQQSEPPPDQAEPTPSTETANFETVAEAAPGTSQTAPNSS